MTVAPFQAICADQRIIREEVVGAALGSIQDRPVKTTEEFADVPVCDHFGEVAHQ